MAIPKSIPSGGVASIIVDAVTLGLAYLAVLARFKARFMTRKAIALDDYLIVAALFFATATIGVGFALVLNGGAGLHMKDATMGEIATSLKLFVPAPLLWAIATGFVKLSILCFYISIFTMPRVRVAVYVVIALTISLLIAVLLESFLLCRPFAFTWDKTIAGGVCGSTQQAYLSIAIVNLVIDLMVVTLPMPVLWKLKMPAKKKIVISAILGMGLVICGITGARIKSVLSLDPMDFTYSMIPDIILGGLEINLGIINACLPILRPLFKNWLGPTSILASVWTKKTENGGSNNSNGTWHSQKPALQNKNFHRLQENQFSIDNTSSIPLTEARAEYDLESQGAKGNAHGGNGNIMVQKDIYMYRTSS